MSLDEIRYVDIVLGLIAFLSFGWGMKRYFIQPDTKSLPMYFVSEVGAFCAVIQILSLVIFHDNMNVVTAFIGAILYTISIFLFWHSIYINRKNKLTLAYMDDEPKFLVQNGAYKFVRHPFYLAYIITWFATPLILLEPLLLITSFIMLFTYIGSAIMEENKFSYSPLSEDYKVYKKNTGMLVPKLTIKLG